MPSDYLHGVKVTETTVGQRPIRTISTSVIGFVATGNNANEEYFPLNKPVLVNNIGEAIQNAGDSGSLMSNLEAIGKQTNPVIVVVRVEEGADEAETTSNIIGTDENGKKTGLQALLVAKSQVGFSPRILGVPGYDNQAVATELATIAEKLRAFAYVSAYNCNTKEEVIAYRNNFSSRELMIIYPDFERWDIVSNSVTTAPATAFALGLRAKIDNEIGWHKTLSNIEVNGVTGISKDVSWDLQSANTDANILNANNVTTLVNAKGYRFWGSRTTSSDPLFSFENYTRTAQIIADMMTEAHLWVLDKPLHPTLVNDIVDGINAKLRSLVTDGYLLGGECWYDEEKNPVNNLKDGKILLSFKYTPVPPIENFTLEQSITDEYLIDFSNKLNIYAA